jgi:Resolvase, N terminal domain
MDYIREGDTVVVWKLDRLGRNTLHILETVKALTHSTAQLLAFAGIPSSHLTEAQRSCSDYEWRSHWIGSESDCGSNAE